MEHTYFFQTLDWRANGAYYDEKGTKVSLYAEVSIVKTKEKWTLDGFMEVGFPTPVRFTSSYKIAETKDKTTLAWEAKNPALGILRGTFELIGGSILSNYVSEDGVYSGAEVLTKLNDTTYYNVGASFQNGTKMSSWTAMIRQKDQCL